MASEREIDAALAALAHEAWQVAPDLRAPLMAGVLADAAVSTLGREAALAAPRPDRALVSAVLADASLTLLAREAAGAAPRPGQALMARVLADAADVAADIAAARPREQAAPRAARTPGGPRLVDWLLGWRAGAAVTMALALALGLGLGFEMKPGTVPLLDRPGSSGPVALASLEVDLLGVGGL